MQAHLQFNIEIKQFTKLFSIWRNIIVSNFKSSLQFGVKFKEREGQRK